MSGEELRALDAEVHRRVMGLECRHNGEDWTYTSPLMRYRDGSPVVCPVPNYSADIGDAWQVVEHLSQLGHRLILEDWRGNVRAGGWAALFDLADGHDTGQQTGETAALAICRAALKAVRTS